MLLAIIVRNFSYGEEKISFFGKEWIQFFRLGTAWGVHGSRGMADAGGEYYSKRGVGTLLVLLQEGSRDTAGITPREE